MEKLDTGEQKRAVLKLEAIVLKKLQAHSCVYVIDLVRFPLLRSVLPRFLAQFGFIVFAIRIAWSFLSSVNRFNRRCWKFFVLARWLVALCLHSYRGILNIYIHLFPLCMYLCTSHACIQHSLCRVWSRSRTRRGVSRYGSSGWEFVAVAAEEAGWKVFLLYHPSHRCTDDSSGGGGSFYRCAYKQRQRQQAEDILYPLVEIRTLRTKIQHTYTVIPVLWVPTNLLLLINMGKIYVDGKDFTPTRM